MVFRKPNFGPPPENYIAGLGRGASGFVTRADFGPAKIGPAANGDPQQIGPGLIRQAPTAALQQHTSVGKPPAEREQDFSDANYDEWTGYGGPLFAGTTDDAEDKEADSVFAKIEDYMDTRRQKKREEKFQEHQKKLEKDKKDISSQFSDLKRQLVNVTRSEWESLPEAPDLVKRTKRQRVDSYQRYTPVPDSVIQSARLDGQTVNYVDPNQSGAASTVNSGFQSIMNGGMVSSLGDIGQARGQLLSLKLATAESVISKQGSTTVSGSTFDKDGYITELNNQQFNNLHDINDFKKARKMFKSVITQNPQNSMGWIAAARIEHLDGKIQEARNMINQACHELPNDEDVWLEAAKLCPPEKVKALLAKAISNIPKSKKLWQMAARKEQDPDIQKQVYQRALEQLPHDLDLWKESIQLANPEEAKSLLYRAVKCVPDSTDLWLALAKLETYENARTVLNEAREAVPTDHTIWVNAAKLEEAQGNSDLVDKIINRAIKKLSRHGVNIKREQWLREAVQAEEGGSLLTCRAIIKETMHYGLHHNDPLYQQDQPQEERDKQLRKLWLENADECVRTFNAVETGRALLFNAIKHYPQKKKLWIKAIELEEKYGSKENVEDLLRRAKDSSTAADGGMKEIYLRLAKFIWKQRKNKEETRSILREGLSKFPESEEIVLALQNFERENQNYKEAERILEQARKVIPNSPKIAMNSVQLYRELGDLPRSLDLANESLKTYRTFYKLWLIKAQVLVALGNNEEARKAYDEALTIDEVKQHREVWLDYARFETDQLTYTRARTILQKARIRMPLDPEIWLASIRLEVRSDNLKIAQNLLSQAIQKCPKSGKLWAQQLEMEPAATRKSQSVNAIQKVDNDSDLFVAFAKVFWTEKKTEKTKTWLKNAITINKDNGDAWAYYLKYQMEFGEQQHIQDVLDQFREAEPRHGEHWILKVKHVDNWRADPTDLLRSLAKELPLFNEI